MATKKMGGKSNILSELIKKMRKKMIDIIPLLGSLLSIYNSAHISNY